MKNILFPLCLAFLLPGAVFAADHSNLEEGLPTEIEDAYPIAYGGREIQSLLRYERTDGNDDRGLWDTRIEYGVARNAQIKLDVPVIFGSEEIDNFSGIGLEGFYNFNQEGIYLPAFAASARVDAPVGENENGHLEGWDTTMKFLASKKIGSAPQLNSVHVNASWKHNFEALPNERENYYIAAIGYSQRVGPDTTMILDYVREQEIEEDKDANLVELGFRHQITPLTLATIGAGAGIGEDSPDFRLTIGFQHAF